MQMGMIGLGRMGANIVRRLMKDGHECVVHNRSRAPIDSLVEEGATGAYSLDELAERLRPPRPVWLMLPAGVTGTIIEQLSTRLDAGDIVIDGGNTHYHDDIVRAEILGASGIHYVDCGTSGGVWGLERGYCLMIGGEEPAVRRLDPLFRSIAPGIDAAGRTPGRRGEPSPAERGYLHCGPAGAGHFVKMVHNGIEYGLMAAYAEGLNILANADVGNPHREIDAETAPLEHPEHYRYDIDVSEVTEVWRRGSVVASWLLDLTAAALAKDPKLDAFGGRVSDSGEARWTLDAAVDEGVPAHVISAALFNRFSSRGLDDFANRVMSAMRKEFGGHDERT
jgi:6-phosphogluconate dehydrogenase